MYFMVQPRSSGGVATLILSARHYMACRDAVGGPRPLAMRAVIDRLADEFSSTGAVDVVDRTLCLGHAGFELDDEFGEAVYQSRVIVLGIGARELDHLAVAVGGLAELAAGLGPCRADRSHRAPR